MSNDRITKWVCEECNALGRFRHAKELDVWTAFEKIREQHAKASPYCQADVATQVRICCEKVK